MVWECLLRKIVVIFSGRQDVNNTEHVAIINLLQGWEMLSDNDMCSFPGSQESWHGDICQHAAHSDPSLHWLLFVHQRRVKWKMFDSFLSVACAFPLLQLSLFWAQNVSGQRVMAVTIWSDTPLPPWWDEQAPGHITRDEHIVTITRTPTHSSHSDTCNHLLISYISSHTSLVMSVIRSVRKRCGRDGAR